MSLFKILHLQNCTTVTVMSKNFVEPFCWEIFSQYLKLWKKLWIPPIKDYKTHLNLCLIFYITNKRLPSKDTKNSGKKYDLNYDIMKPMTFLPMQSKWFQKFNGIVI